MKYSIIYRQKENRYMAYFYFLNKQYCQYGKTKNEALEKIRKKRKEVLSNYKNNTNDVKNTLNYWYEYWIENIRKPLVKESTYNQTIELYNRHVIKTIGKNNVNNISSIKLQDFINNISSTDARRKIYNILENIFDMLHKMNLIKNNPMAIVINPKNKNSFNIDEELDSKILTYEEEKILLNTIKNSKCYHAVKFILYTGLRRGECLGLQWKHIDLDKMLINVKQQYNKSLKKITSTKSKAAIRSIPILPPAKEILDELIKFKTSNEDFIFKDLNRLTNHLVYFSNKLGFKITPHILRHTFASRLYFAGLNPKIIQTLLGHEKMDTTLNTYTHLINPNDEPIIKLIRQYLISTNLINN